MPQEVKAGAPVGGVSQTPTTALASRVQVVGRIADTDPGIPDERLATSIYTNCRIVCKWRRDTQVAHCAPTDTEAESAAVALAAPTLQLTVEYQCERIGGPPSIPSSDLGSNFELLGSDEQPGEVGLAPDGATPIYRTSGWMVFMVRNPKRVVRGAAIPPWIVEQLRQLKKVAGAQASINIDKMLALGAGAPTKVEPGILPWATGNQ